MLQDSPRDYWSKWKVTWWPWRSSLDAPRCLGNTGSSWGIREFKVISQMYTIPVMVAYSFISPVLWVWSVYNTHTSLSLVVQMGNNPPATQETWIQSLSWEAPLEKEMAAHSSILAWRIPQTEEPGGLQALWLQRVSHYWETHTHTYIHIHNMYNKHVISSWTICIN